MQSSIAKEAITFEHDECDAKVDRFQTLFSRYGDASIHFSTRASNKGVRLKAGPAAAVNKAKDEGIRFCATLFSR